MANISPIVDAAIMQMHTLGASQPGSLSLRWCVQVLDFLTHNLHMLEHGDHCGAVSFFYSIVLSKGINAIYEEMDNSECTLVGKFGCVSVGSSCIIHIRTHMHSQLTYCRDTNERRLKAGGRVTT